MCIEYASNCTHAHVYVRVYENLREHVHVQLFYQSCMYRHVDSVMGLFVYDLP